MSIFPVHPQVSIRHRKSGQTSRQFHQAFTLVEMLVVMAIIVLIIAIGAPVLRGVLGARGVANSVDAINGFLTNARIQATSQNTYVVVGFMQAVGSDDLQMAAVRSTSGTFDPANFPGSSPTAANIASYQPLGAIVHLANVTLSPYTNLPTGLQNKVSTGLQDNPNSGKVIPDPPSTDPSAVVVPDTPSKPASSTTPMAFSFGTAVFNWYLIVFTPQGEALYFPAAGATATNNTPFYSRLFIGLCTSRNGNAVTNDLTAAALLLDGGAGNINVYRL